MIDDSDGMRTMRPRSFAGPIVNAFLCALSGLLVQDFRTTTTYTNEFFKFSCLMNAILFGPNPFPKPYYA